MFNSTVAMVAQGGGHKQQMLAEDVSMITRDALVGFPRIPHLDEGTRGDVISALLSFS
jgi:hypothetical protein